MTTLPERIERLRHFQATAWTSFPSMFNLADAVDEAMAVITALEEDKADLIADLAMYRGQYRLDMPEGQRTKEEELRAVYALLFNQLNPVMERNAELERKVAVAQKVITSIYDLAQSRAFISGACAAIVAFVEAEAPTFLTPTESPPAQATTEAQNPDESDVVDAARSLIAAYEFAVRSGRGITAIRPNVTILKEALAATEAQAGDSSPFGPCGKHELRIHDVCPQCGASGALEYLQEQAGESGEVLS